MTLPADTVVNPEEIMGSGLESEGVDGLVQVDLDDVEQGGIVALEGNDGHESDKDESSTQEETDNGDEEEASVDEEELKRRKRCCFFKIMVGLALLGVVIYIIVDAATTGNVTNAIRNFLGWIQENPAAGVFAFMAGKVELVYLRELRVQLASDAHTFVRVPFSLLCCYDSLHPGLDPDSGSRICFCRSLWLGGGYCIGDRCRLCWRIFGCDRVLPLGAIPSSKAGGEADKEIRRF